MKIIILGAGQVGGTLAENLVGENTISPGVPIPTAFVSCRTNSICARTGHGSHPRVLREAGAEDADMLVAVTILTKPI
ncbi:NAD-binding protein [Serratia odorifera]|uniref:NAD-binding protein n=1 Tax=Serratia odorifera TaxID=618 RepID=UPI001D11E82D|nr:NAD-binding protein [Serratia odorifera]